MIYLLEISHVKDSERISVTIPFQTDLSIPFLFNEFYSSFNSDQNKFLENFSSAYIDLETRKKFPGFALKFSRETLLTF